MKDTFDYPSVSISIVNLNGKHYLEQCIPSIKELDYPQDKIEIIVVDNGSTDGSVYYLKKEYRDIKIIENKKNTGFAYANNQAAKAAEGKFIAFLNNDTKVDKNWLRELIRPVNGNDEIAVAGSKVLSIDGSKLDFAGSMINFEGKGFQIDFGIPVGKDTHKQYEYLPFVNGGAMIADREIFLESGGFDEDYFAYYEDVDFGWRMWILGYKVVFAPESIIYHIHHGTSKAFGEDKLRYLRERNALYSIFKNYDESNLPKILSSTLASVFNRIFVDFKFDYKDYYNFDLTETSKNISGELEKKIDSLNMPKEPLSSLMAVKDFFDNLDLMKGKREYIQKNRKRDDKALFTYFKGQFLSVSGDEQYQDIQIKLLESLGIYDVFKKQINRKVLIVSSEVVAEEMAGPAIRVWNFAKVLSQYMEVVLAIPNEIEIPQQEFTIARYTDDSSLNHLIEDVDIIISGGTTFIKYPSIKNSDKFLVIDIYDPYNLSTLAEFSKDPMQKRLDVHKLVHYNLNEQLYYGDFFICASERQRDYWIGMLAALNRAKARPWENFRL